MSIAKLKTVFADGAWIPNVKTFYKKINEIIDALNSLVTSTTPNYKIYRAVISQSGTNPPSALYVLENTLTESPTFYYDNVGAFRIGSNDFGLEGDNKVFVLCNEANQNDASKQLDCYITTGPLVRGEKCEIALETVNGTIFTNGLIFKTSIEIKVYN